VLALPTESGLAFDQRLAGSEAALRACGATTVRSDIAYRRDTAIVLGEIEGANRAVLVLDTTVVEVTVDAPLDAVQPYWMEGGANYENALFVTFPRLDDGRSTQTEGIAYARVAGGAVARSFACADGAASIVSTTCGRTIVCGPDHHPALAFYRGELARSTPCLEALRAVQAAALERVARDRAPWDALRAPSQAACTATADDAASVNATLRAEFSDDVMDDMVSSLVGCADASGRRLVVIDRDLTTQQIVRIEGRRVRPVGRRGVALTLQHAVDIDGDGATEWMALERRQLGDEGAHTVDRHLLLGPSLSAPIVLPATQSGLRPRVITFRGGIAVVGADGVYRFVDGRLERVPDDPEVAAVRAVQAAASYSRERYFQLDDVLIDPPVGSPDCDASWREDLAGRVAMVLVQLGVEAERAVELGAAPFRCVAP
jgi:hypothetical protein